MNIFSRVSVFALGPLVGTACRVAGVSILADGPQRFRDSSPSACPTRACA